MSVDVKSPPRVLVWASILQHRCPRDRGEGFDVPYSLAVKQPFCISVFVDITRTLSRNGLDMVPGANFECLLHHFSSLIRLMGSWGQLPKSFPKLPKTKIIICPRVLTATELTLDQKSAPAEGSAERALWNAGHLVRSGGCPTGSQKAASPWHIRDPGHSGLRSIAPETGVYLLPG